MIANYLQSTRRYFDIPDKSRIFAFGCWNKNRKETARIIASLKGYDFGVVIGDNIYARGEGEAVRLSDIDSGFAVLSQSPAKIFMGLGNHDVDSRHILAKELAAARQYGLEMPANWYQLGDGIMVIDTNFFYTRNAVYSEATDMETDMFHALIRAMTSYKGPRPFLIFGHYPPAFYKSTPDRSWVIYNQRMHRLNEILLSYQRPVTYVSADAHNHQHLQLANIDIWIAGTGGGDLDRIHHSPKASPYYVTINGRKYPVIVKDCYDGHGYLDIKVSPQAMKVAFRPST